MKAVIFGASSAIAEETARQLALRGAELFLVARRQDKLDLMAADLAVRGAAKVTSYIMDMNDFAAHQACLDSAQKQLGQLDLVLVAHGTLGDQQACEQSVELTLDELNTNGVSVIALLTPLANLMANQGHGTIVVISSVAGDRGRQSNYVYGAAKALVTTFLQGLRNRLSKQGVHVVTVKPGFVDTPMTAAFDKGLLWAKPEAIARGILQAVDKQKNVVYLPFFWRYIMLIIGHIPEFVFKKLSL